jgi:hypothetical protein
MKELLKTDLRDSCSSSYKLLPNVPAKKQEPQVILVSCNREG